MLIFTAKPSSPCKRPAVTALLLTAACLLLATSMGARAAPIGFTAQNVDFTSNPTAMEFGPDERLYVSELDGTILAYTIERDLASGDYTVLDKEIIELIRTLPNHDDDGSPHDEEARNIAGLTTTGTAESPEIYVSSSDPRIDDTDADTNSGVLSRLYRDNGTWQRHDLVRGLPRSVHDHFPNGLALDEATQTLYLAQGGHTNMGAPSINFGLLSEYALSAAILTIDLAAIGETTYDLPTLNGTATPFGGQGGANQAVLEADGPVQIHAPGFRNPYDVLQTASGRLYMVDNGPNAGWGDMPAGEGSDVCLNSVQEGGFDAADGLHLIPSAGYYGGHPNPVRANPDIIFDGASPVAAGNPRECDYLVPGVENGALMLFPASTNGLAEYTASNFDGAMQGNLLATSWNGNVTRVALNESGDTVVASEALFTSLAGPLGITAQGDSAPFPGTIWVGQFLTGAVSVFEPTDFTECHPCTPLIAKPGQLASEPLDTGKAYTKTISQSRGTADGEPAILRLNAGLDAPTMIGGVEWQGDGLFLVPGSSAIPFAVPDSEIAGTANDELYRTERFGSPFGYAAPVANGIYRVRLHFAEIFHGVFTAGLEPGDRVFDVLLEGERRVTELDLAEAAGAPLTAHIIELQVTVDDGVLDVGLELGPNGVDQAQLSGLEVFVIETFPQASTVIATPPAVDFGSVTVDDTATARIVLANPGDEMVTISTLAIDGAEGAFTLQAPPAPPLELAAGAKLALTMAFSPGYSGTFNDLLTLTHDGAESPLEIPLDGFGEPPEIPLGPAFLRFNAGSDVPTMIGDVEWQSDTAWLVPDSEADAFSVPDVEIAGTDDDLLYGSDRFGTTFGYAVPVDNGTYRLRFHFAEIFHGVLTPALDPGDRVFDILLEGRRRVTELDLAIAIGAPLTAHIIELEAVVNDRVLDVGLELGTNGVDQAKLSGLEVFVVEIEPRSGTVKATPGAVNFGSLAVGERTTTDILLTNPGNASVTIKALLVDDPQGEFTLQAPPAVPLQLAPGAESTLTVAVTPLEGGSVSGLLTITHDGVGGLLEVMFNGVGVPDLLLADGFES